METLGEYLQRHRKAAGYTIEDVARITRINPHYLRALEENDFKRLPAPTFTQGFLRSYARLLSLDEHDVVERFRRKDQPQGHIQTQQVRKPSPKETVPLPEIAVPEEPTWRASWQDHWNKEKTVYMVVFGVFCLGVIVFLILHPLGRETSNVPTVVEDAPVPPPAETSTGTETSLSETQEAGTNAAAEPKGEDTGIPSPQESPLLLTFTAREDCWIRVVIDGGEVRSILLSAGGKIQWSAREKFLVTLGNAGGVEAILNDRPLGSFGERGQVIRSLLITRDGVSSVPGLSVNSPKDFPENRPTRSDN